MILEGSATDSARRPALGGSAAPVFGAFASTSQKPKAAAKATQPKPKGKAQPDAAASSAAQRRRTSQGNHAGAWTLG